MKKLSLLASVLAITVLCSVNMSAQFHNYTKGTIFRYSYEDFESDEKGEETYVLADLQRDGDKLFVRMDMPSDSTASDIPLGDMTGMRYVCDDSGIVRVVLMSGEDLKKQINDIMSAVFSQSEMEVSEEELEAIVESNGEISFDLSHDAAAGESFPDSEVKAKMSFVKYTVSLSKGVYGGRETVSTPAGDFDCVKVSYRMKINCMMSTVVNSYMTEWYSPEHGLVRSETRDKKGQILTSSVLKSVQELVN